MYLRLFAFFLLVLLLCSCATVEPERSEGAAKPVIEPQQGRYYTVQMGDTLYRIGKKFDVDWKKIAEANSIDPGSPITVGQRLIIPGEFSEQAPVEAKSVPEKAESPPEVPKQQPKKDEGVKYVAGEKFSPPVSAQVAVSFGQTVGATASRGIEYSLSSGSEVKAARTGVVVTVFERFPGFGRVVIIDHGFGFATFYGYMGKVGVREGDRVKKGEAIGKSGVKPTTGKGALHFRIYKDGAPVNPASYIR